MFLKFVQLCTGSFNLFSKTLMFSLASILLTKINKKPSQVFLKCVQFKPRFPFANSAGMPGSLKTKLQQCRLQASRKLPDQSF